MGTIIGIIIEVAIWVIVAISLLIGVLHVFVVGAALIYGVWRLILWMLSKETPIIPRLIVLAVVLAFFWGAFDYARQPSLSPDDPNYGNPRYDPDYWNDPDDGGYWERF